MLNRRTVSYQIVSLQVEKVVIEWKYLDASGM